MRLVRAMGNLVVALFAIFWIWVGVSIIEVIIKNLNPDPVYWSYNLFIILIEAVK